MTHRIRIVVEEEREVMPGHRDFEERQDYIMDVLSDHIDPYQLAIEIRDDATRKVRMVESLLHVAANSEGRRGW